jgi:hypothetical protein
VNLKLLWPLDHARSHPHRADVGDTTRTRPALNRLSGSGGSPSACFSARVESSRRLYLPSAGTSRCCFTPAGATGTASVTSAEPRHPGHLRIRTPPIAPSSLKFPLWRVNRRSVDWLGCVTSPLFYGEPWLVKPCTSTRACRIEGLMPHVSVRVGRRIDEEPRETQLKWPGGGYFDQDLRYLCQWCSQRYHAAGMVSHTDSLARSHRTRSGTTFTEA